MLILLPVPAEPELTDEEYWKEYPVPGAAAAKTEAKAEEKTEAEAKD